MAASGFRDRRWELVWRLPADGLRGEFANHFIERSPGDAIDGLAA